MILDIDSFTCICIVLTIASLWQSFRFAFGSMVKSHHLYFHGLSCFSYNSINIIMVTISLSSYLLSVSFFVSVDIFMLVTDHNHLRNTSHMTKNLVKLINIFGKKHLHSYTSTHLHIYTLTRLNTYTSTHLHLYTLTRLHS